MPTYAQWEYLSGGKEGRNLPLLKYIDARMYEHSIYARYVEQHNQMEAERLCCLIQLWYALRMYVKSYSKPGSTFNRNKRSAIRADGYRKVNLGAQGNHNRIDAIEALEELVSQELMVMTGTTRKDALKEKIKRAEVLGLTKHGAQVDSNRSKDNSRLLVKHLSIEERSAFRLLLEGGRVKMHPRGVEADPLEWINADTRTSKSNNCHKDLLDTMVQSMDQFTVGKDAFNTYMRQNYSTFGTEGYVMTHSRKMFMSNSHSGQNTDTDTAGFFHSSYTSGGDVVCSGSVRFNAGIPTLLTNLSGHYAPPAMNLDRVIRMFEMMSIPLNQLNIIAQTSKTTYAFFPSNNINQFRSAIQSGIHQRFMG
jgi:hypothetical protein